MRTFSSPIVIVEEVVDGFTDASAGFWWTRWFDSRSQLRERDKDNERATERCCCRVVLPGGMQVQVQVAEGLRGRVGKSSDGKERKFKSQRGH